MTTFALNSAIAGLSIAQKSIDVTANNVANASTDGYTKKILPQETVVVDGSAVGVRAQTVYRHMNNALLRDYRTQVTKQAGLEVRESYLERIQAFHGNPSAELNFVSQLTDLREAFTQMTSQPESTGLQSEALNIADVWARTINQFAAESLRLRNEIQEDIRDTVTEANGYLDTIADYNRKIASSKNVNQPIAVLEDQRDLAVRELAKIMDITYFEDGDGVLVVQDRRGQPLADRSPRTLEFNYDSLGYQSAYPFDVSGVTVDLGRAGIIDYADQRPGGSLGALLELRDDTMPTYMAQMDELAHKVALRFDAQNVRLFTNELGVVPPDDPLQYNGFAATIRVNETILNNPSLLQSGTAGPPVNPGSSAVLENIVNHTFGDYQDDANTPHATFRTRFLGPANDITLNLAVTNVSVIKFGQSILSTQATEHRTVRDALELEQSYTNDVQKRLLDEVAVNTDEEMAKLIELQQGYTAAAQIVGVLRELFQSLITAV